MFSLTTLNFATNVRRDVRAIDNRTMHKITSLPYIDAGDTAAQGIDTDMAEDPRIVDYYSDLSLMWI